ncbi:hypothetical protein [Eisenibacter elegans]|uniref:hypothetical protein n=1 Tax=Eisenibacter elegans TaxID=997 RepID=UPI0003F4EC09|nr:hypothetical protein [Eisenibacter elegans]
MNLQYLGYLVYGLRQTLKQWFLRFGLGLLLGIAYLDRRNDLPVLHKLLQQDGLRYEMPATLVQHRKHQLFVNTSMVAYAQSLLYQHKSPN